MKSLEEFIEAGSAKELVDDKNYRSVALETAAEILRVAEEYGEKDCPLKCEAHSEREKEIFSTGYEEGVWGLIDFLKSYIQPVKKESEDGNT